MPTRQHAADPPSGQCGVATLHIGAPTRAAVSPQLNLAQPAELHLRIKEGANRLAAIFLTTSTSPPEPTSPPSTRRANSSRWMPTSTMWSPATSSSRNWGWMPTPERCRPDRSLHGGLYLPNISTPSNNISARIADNRIDLSARLSNAESELNALLELESRLERRNDSLSVRHASTRPPTSPRAHDAGISPPRPSFTLPPTLPSTGSSGQRRPEPGLDGTYGDTKSDTLRLSLNDFNLSLLTTSSNCPPKPSVAPWTAGPN